METLVKNASKARVKQLVEANTVVMGKDGKDKPISAYAQNVLTVNQAFKHEFKTLHGVRTVMLALGGQIEGFNANYQLVLNQSIGKSALNNATYKMLQRVVRVSKSNKYGIFYTLQALHFITETQAFKDGLTVENCNVIATAYEAKQAKKTAAKVETPEAK
jgi:uncharacterized protein (DUF486 family)